MVNIKKTLKWFFLLIALLAILFTLPAFFYHQQLNIIPLPSHYKKGVYHIHSSFSDGRGTPLEICRAAQELNLDFAILTDHGNPNILSLETTGWTNDVLLIGGSELSLNSGHLATAGYRTPDYLLPPEPQEAIDDVNRARGISFISHPFDDHIPWTDWDIRNFTGIEVFNSYSSARRAGLLKLLLFPMQYAINPKYALLNTLAYPRENLEKWDSLNRHQKYFSIYACDAHAVLPISGNMKLNFPSYKSMFEIFHTYVKVGSNLSKDASQSASAIISAMKKGHFFNVVEAIAPANGFENYFIGSNGAMVEMGESCKTRSGRYIIRLPFDFETRIIIKRNGKQITEINRNRKKMREIAISGPGVYRAEIFVSRASFSALPWILTNPIYIGMEYDEPVDRLPRIQKHLVDREDFFSGEANRHSRAKVTTTRNDRGEWITNFSYRLKKEPKKKDFWASIARRKSFDFSSHTGFMFKARSRYDARFWIEFRTGTGKTEAWYRHSFRAGPAWKTVHIPFKKFSQIRGKTTIPALNRIRSVFFSINNAIAYPGSRGKLVLKDIGLTGGNRN